MVIFKFSKKLHLTILVAISSPVNRILMKIQRMGEKRKKNGRVLYFFFFLDSVNGLLGLLAIISSYYIRMYICITYKLAHSSNEICTAFYILSNLFHCLSPLFFSSIRNQIKLYTYICRDECAYSSSTQTMKRITITIQ